MNLKPFIATVIAATLVGCAQAPLRAPEKIAADIEQQKSDIIVARETVHRNENVFHYAGVYVEQLSLAQSVLPQWYHEEISSTYSDLEIRKLMREVFANKRVNVEYRDGVERDKKVTVTGDNLTYGNVLEAIAAVTGYTFDVTDNRVVFRKYETKVFPIRVVGGSIKYSIGKTRLGQDSAGSSSGDEVKSDLVATAGDEYSIVSGQVDPLLDFKLGIDEILGCQNQLAQASTEAKSTGIGQDSAPAGETATCANGSSATVVSSNNSLIVRATPSQLEQVAHYVDQQHEVAMRQIRVNLTLFTVEVAKDTSLNLDLDLTDGSLFGSNLAVKHVTSAFSNALGGLGNSGNTTLQHTNGSKLALEALSKQGSVLQSSVLRAVLLNHRVTQLTSVSKVSYISDRPQQVTLNVGTSRGIEQKVARSGTLLYLMPNIGKTDAVLHISSSQSALIRLDQKGEGDSQVESPVVDDKLLNTTVILKPGRPVFVGGFSNDELSAIFSASGSLAPGMGRSSRDKNVETVMLVEMEFI